MFSEKQIQVLGFPNVNKDAIICDGAVRSGKSSVISISYIIWAMTNFSNSNFGVCSKSVRSAERNIIKPLQNIKYMNDNYDMKYTISTSMLTITRGSVTNYFYVFGGKDESSYSTIQGITLAGVFLDEVVLMPESFVNQALARCSIRGSKYWFSCNPEGPNHWFYKEWILKAEEKNSLYLHFTLDDNPSLDDTIKKRYHKMYSGVFYERYILGKWVRAEGIIYRDFADNPNSYIIDKVPNDLIMINAGVDFGGTKSAHAFVATGFTTNFEQAIVLYTERIPDELSTHELEDRYATFVTMINRTYGKFFNTRADSAEPVLIRGLKNKAMELGLRTSVKRALKKPIKDRIELVVKLLGENRLKLLRNTTIELQDALKMTVWDPKKEDVRLDDGVTSSIDIIDAFEYSIEEFSNMLIDYTIIERRKG
jgi:PBSX family phage terminase large subunit